MRVAAYYPWVYLRGGGERVLLELMRRSRHEWTLFTNRFEPQDTYPGFGEIDIVELPRVPVKRNVWNVAKAGLTLLTQRLPLRRFDALMVCMESLGNLVTLRSGRRPTFCLCLTPLRVAYDPLTRQRFLQNDPNLLTRAAVSVFAQLDRRIWPRYRKVFCISQEVARRLQNTGLVTDDRIQVVYPGVDLDYFGPDGQAEPFFLLPGRIMWTKNIELGIRAFLHLKRLTPAAQGYRLIVAGVVDHKSHPYLEHLRAIAGDNDAVEFVVDPSDELYRDLHRRSYAVLFTAFNEDWGLVPLEAMATMKPVVAVNQGGPSESVLHGQTGFLSPPEPADFARSMEALIQEEGLAERMGMAARERAASFSWDNFVTPIDDYIDSLAMDSRPHLRLTTQAQS